MRIFALSLLALAMGCGAVEDNTVSEPAPPANTAAAVASPAPQPTDDPQALDLLKQHSLKLKSDNRGLVIEVDFRDQPFDVATLGALTGLPRLRSLRLAGIELSDDDLAKIGALDTLRDLDLRNCPIGNAGLSHLEALSNLRALRLSGKSGATLVDDEGMASIGKLAGLKALLLDFLFVSEDGLKQLAGLTNLEEIYLAGTLVGDDAIPVLNQFTKLKKLRLSQTQVSSQGMTGLQEMVHLQELDLSENSLIFDEGLAHLSAMKQLTKLNLWRVQVTDTGVQELAGLTNLRWLNLDNTQLSDGGLPALQGLVQLEFLHLGSTAITDAGLSNLESLEALKELKVTRTNVTDKGVAALQQKLPQSAIQLKYIESQ